MALRFALFVGVWFAAVPAHADGNFERERSTHFLLLHDLEFSQRTGRSGSSRFERDVLQSLERSFRDLDAFVGLAPRRRIDVVVHDRARFDRDLAWRFRFPSAGFFADRIHIRGAPRVDIPLASVLAHELVHAAFHQQAPGLQLPAWMNEGIAMWFEARRIGKKRLSRQEHATLLAAARRGHWLSMRELSVPSFAAFAASEAGPAYLQSYALLEHLSEKRGERVVRDWVVGTLRSRDPSRALDRASGLRPEALDESLRRSLRF